MVVTPHHNPQRVEHEAGGEVVRENMELLRRFAYGGPNPASYRELENTGFHGS